MKRTFLLLSALTLCSPVAAGLDLETAFSQAIGAARLERVRMQQAAAARQELPPRETYAEVNACWARPAHAQADALGLPAKFCIRRVGVSIPRPFELPFVEGSALIVEGEPVSGRLHVDGGARKPEGWNIVGQLMSKDVPQACGELNYAFAAVYVDIDAAGNVRGTRPEVRGFLMDASSLCRTPAKSVEILYSPVP